MRVAWGDWSKKPLGRMMRQRLRPLRMCQITQYAYNSLVYAAALRSLKAMPHRPRVIMLPVLMRQFSPQLSRNPSLLFREEIEAMDAYAEQKARVAAELRRELPHKHGDRKSVV